MKVVSEETKTVKSTFNGSEVESFSWYKKALGLA